MKKRMKYYVWVGMAVLLVGCQKETAEMPPEDYSNSGRLL